MIVYITDLVTNVWMNMQQPAHLLDDDREIIPVVEEQAVVRKRKRLTNGVRVRTTVHEDEQVIDEPMVTEQVEVERITLGHWVEAPVPVRQEGDVTIVTLHEEVVVVETRLRATEEVRLIRRQPTSSTRKHVTLRREEALIERLDIAAETKGDTA
jgi:stress response protein YsnF